MFADLFVDTGVNHISDYTIWRLSNYRGYNCLLMQAFTAVFFNLVSIIHLRINQKLREE